MDYCMSTCSWKNMSNQNNLMPFCFKGNTLEPQQTFSKYQENTPHFKPVIKSLYIS